MVIEKIIIGHLYKPSSAATNRILAYAKSFVSLGKRVSLVLGCDEVHPLPQIEGVEVFGVTSPFHILLFPKMAQVMREHYTKEQSVILVYGSPLFCLFLPKTRYNIFFECTEVPMNGMTESGVHKLKEILKLYLAKRATGMLVISNALVDYYTDRGINNISVINMFVDSSRFDTVLPLKRKKVIAYCGTISLHKDGVDSLIKAFNLFRRFHSGYILKIIGRFEDKKAEDSVKGLVKQLSLDEDVDFTGMVMPNEIPPMLKGAKMLVLARPNNRQAQYGFPTKLGEYLATKNPVVVTNVGEIGVFLRDGVNCCMAKPGDEKDFAEKMAWIADHEVEAKELGERGWLLTQKEFSALEQSRRALAFMEVSE